MPNRYFIADVHLSSTRPTTLALWQRFIQNGPQTGDSLYILGDLFDTWVGDDDDAPLAEQVRHTLRQLTQRGVTLGIQRGNRDFMLGKTFARQVGATLLPDQQVLQVAGLPTLLLHGDQLCTDDHAYQKARRRLRNPCLQWLLRHRSLAARRRIATAYRERSLASQAQRNLDELDAVTTTVLDYLQRYQVQQMIHGHTHRPAVHQHTLPHGQIAYRYVLDEWHTAHASVWVDDGARLYCNRLS